MRFSGGFKRFIPTVHLHLGRDLRGRQEGIQEDQELVP